MRPELWVQKGGNEVIDRRPCTFCENVLSAQAESRPWDTVVLQNSRAVAVPTIGSLVSGWLLALPCQHVLSTGRLRSDDRDLLMDLVVASRARVEAAFGPAVLFEHGPANAASLVGCGVDHAHIHIVPWAGDLIRAGRSILPEARIIWTRLAGWSGLTEFNDQPYLAYEQEGTLSVGVGEIPSQYFRRVIAACIGRGTDFDWRRDECEAEIATTLAGLASVERD